MSRLLSFGASPLSPQEVKLLKVVVGLSKDMKRYNAVETQLQEFDYQTRHDISQDKATSQVLGEAPLDWSTKPNIRAKQTLMAWVHNANHLAQRMKRRIKTLKQLGVGSYHELSQHIDQLKLALRKANKSLLTHPDTKQQQRFLSQLEHLNFLKHLPRVAISPLHAAVSEDGRTPTTVPEEGIRMYAIDSDCFREVQSRSPLPKVDSYFQLRPPKSLMDLVVYGNRYLSAHSQLVLNRWFLGSLKRAVYEDIHQSGLIKFRNLFNAH